jgi:hypothetical protein
VLSERQRKYAQVKRELWGIVSAIKSDREYLIGAEVVIETDFLPILGMISGSNTPDIAMLQWIAYIKSLGPEIRHIAGKRNVVADMLSRARYEGGEEQGSDREEVGSDFFTSSFVRVHATFMEQDYDNEFVDIGKYLSTLRRDEASRTTDDFHCIRKKAYNYLLKDGHLWRHPQKNNGIPMCVVCKLEEQHRLIKEFHDSAWVGHRGVWATFAKLKEKYWWLGFYKNVTTCVETCKNCQI